MSNLPKFLCIGVQKAATSWLWVQLRHHPSIWMPPVKELHYFDHLYVEENRNWTTGHIRKSVCGSLQWHAKNEKINLDYFRYMVDLGTRDLFTEGWYKRAFLWPAAADRMTGDVTPEYCMISEEGVSYVRSLLGKAKIIVMLREPVSRAISQIRMNAARRGIDLDLASEEEWLALANEPVLASRSSYEVFPTLWSKAFGPENLHFIDYDQVSTSPAAVLRNLELFLGIPATEYPAPKQPVHVGKKLAKNAPAKVLNTLAANLRSQVAAYSQLKLLSQTKASTI